MDYPAEYNQLFGVALHFMIDLVHSLELQDNILMSQYFISDVRKEDCRYVSNIDNSHSCKLSSAGTR